MRFNFRTALFIAVWEKTKVHVRGMRARCFDWSIVARLSKRATHSDALSRRLIFRASLTCRQVFYRAPPCETINGAHPLFDVMRKREIFPFFCTIGQVIVDKYLCRPPRTMPWTRIKIAIASFWHCIKKMLFIFMKKKARNLPVRWLSVKFPSRTMGTVFFPSLGKQSERRF